MCPEGQSNAEGQLLPSPRRYRDERDLARMIALLQAGRAARIPTYYVHTGDLKWWLYYPPLVGPSWFEHIYLWEDPANPARLLGWALLDPAGETFDVYPRPDLSATPTAEAMYTWAEDQLTPLAHAAGRTDIGVFWVVPEDTFFVGWLEARGYRVKHQHTALSSDLTQPIAPCALPTGFRIRPCRGLPEVEVRARAQYGAFGSTAPFEAYVERFTRFMKSSAYPTATDLVVSTPDKAIAAFCILWPDDLNHVALFEPVGTHPDYQRKGLGKALLLEAQRVLQMQGMVEAIVCTPETNTPAIKLYESVGFKKYTDFRFYAKTI